MKEINMWDEVAQSYEESSYYEKDGNYPANMFRARIILDFLSRQRKGRLLDAGCGTGYLIRTLSNLGWDCVGIDTSKKMLEVAREKASNIVIKFGTVLDMDGFKKEFDIVMLNGVLPYIDEKDEVRAYRECNRVLKEGGCLIVSQYNSILDIK